MPRKGGEVGNEERKGEERRRRSSSEKKSLDLVAKKKRVGSLFAERGPEKREPEHWILPSHFDLHTQAVS